MRREPMIVLAYEFKYRMVLFASFNAIFKLIKKELLGTFQIF